jgi:hypothetical protein
VQKLTHAHLQFPKIFLGYYQTSARRREGPRKGRGGDKTGGKRRRKDGRGAPSLRYLIFYLGREY